MGTLCRVALSETPTIMHVFVIYSTYSFHVTHRIKKLKLKIDGCGGRFETADSSRDITTCTAYIRLIGKNQKKAQKTRRIPDKFQRCLGIEEKKIRQRKRASEKRLSYNE